MSERENKYPTRVQSVTDLPEGFQQAIQCSLKPDEQINSILMLPPQPFLKRGGVPRQVLLSTAHGILHVDDRKPTAATYLPGESLTYVRHTLVLLYGRLELTGEVDGKPVSVVAEYNTVGQELLDAALAQFLLLTYGMNRSCSEPERGDKALLEKLGAESFKFMNGLHLHALGPGERLLGYVFQPRIRERLLRFFHRPIAPAALFALTDRAVVLIEEDKTRGASYGWVVTICPRKIVLDVEIKPMEKWHELSVALMRNKVRMERKLILENDTALACRSLWSSQTS
jgi:hypothetical protein